VRLNTVNARPTRRRFSGVVRSCEYEVTVTQRVPAGAMYRAAFRPKMMFERVLVAMTADSGRQS
jgi:hypothetical protein